MPTIIELVAEFNALVPQAQARGISVRFRNSPYKNITVGQRRLAWLRSQLLTGSATPAQIDAAIESQTFGCELEVIMPMGMGHTQLAAALVAGGVPCVYMGYTHSTTETWKVVTDASLGRNRGAELVSPILTGAAELENLKRVCDIARQAGCKINKRCGFHVHVGVRNEGLKFFKQLAKLYKKYEPVIDTLVAPSRRSGNNNYCGPMYFSEAMLDSQPSVSAMARVMGGKFKKLNFEPFTRQGTVEFRQHQGTVDGHKAEQWVRFCLRMVAAAKVASGPDMGDVALGVLLSKLAVQPSEQAYFESRQAAFAEATERDRVARRSFS